MSTTSPFHRIRAPFLLFLLALVARLVAWPFSDVVDADAVTRALAGESYMRYPGWAGDGIWPPLHIYLSGLSGAICGSRVTGSVLVNILLGSAIVFPVFAFVRRWSGEAAALAVVILVVFGPLLMRNSLQGMSEVPFFFLAACAINSVSVAQTANGPRAMRQAALGGTFLTVACGMRYEGWLLMGPLASMLLFVRHWRLASLFTVVAMVFPIIWMITCHKAHGNALTGVEHMLHATGSSADAAVSGHELRIRALFFPVSLLLACTPVAVLIGLYGSGVALFNGRLGADRWPWLLLFPALLIFMVIKARDAQILLQHRFTLTLILLFVPYLALGFSLLRTRLLIISSAVVLTAWASTDPFRAMAPPWLRVFIEDENDLQRFAHRDLGPVPVLEHRLADSIVAVVNSVPMENKLVVLDFIGWQDTYNIGFRSDAFASSVVYLSTVNGECDAALEQLQDYLDRLHEPHGVLILNEAGPCMPHLASDTLLRLPVDDLELKFIKRFEGIRIHSFRLRPSTRLEANGQ